MNLPALEPRMLTQAIEHAFGRGGEEPVGQGLLLVGWQGGLRLLGRLDGSTMTKPDLGEEIMPIGVSAA